MSFRDSPFMSVGTAEACAIKSIDEVIDVEHLFIMVVSMSITAFQYNIFTRLNRNAGYPNRRYGVRPPPLHVCLCSRRICLPHVCDTASVT